MACLREALGAPQGGGAGVLAQIEARPAGPQDESFLRQLYASTRADEMAATGWPASRCRAFLDQQFEFQHRYYRAHHPQALFLVLFAQGQPIGRLYWRSEADCATLIDLSLLPGHRGQGLGSAILHLLVAEADRHGQRIELHVEPDNRAHRLYRRFGFEVECDNSMHLKMRRPASLAVQRAAPCQCTPPCLCSTGAPA